MVRKQYLSRMATIYFRSSKDKDFWQKEAEAAGLSVSSFLLTMADQGLSKSKKPKENPGLVTDLRDNVSQLLIQNKNLEAMCQNYETQLLKMKCRAFVSPQTPGPAEFSKELIEVLRRGNIWSGFEILKAMNISPKDVDAIDIIQNQLRDLQDYGLVQEDTAGWRWIG